MAAKRRRRRKQDEPADEPFADDPTDEEESSGGLLTRFLFRPRVMIAIAAAVAATFVVPPILERLPDLHGRSEYRLRTAEIEVNEPPPAAPRDLVAQVIEQAGLPEELSLLDEDVAARVANAFGRHPWVAEVLEVKKLPPARLTVRLRYRRPVAMIEVAQGVYPVDAEGHLLPPSDFSVADTKRYPLVRNIRTAPAGAAGESWGDDRVVAAAELAEVLLPHWKPLDLGAILIPVASTPPDQPSTIREVPVDARAADVQFELLTRDGSRILWGRRPGTDHPGELTAEQKIGRLKKYLADFGGFDQPHGPYEIDIRHWREISRRPITRRRREARAIDATDGITTRGTTNRSRR